jgi:hypothetical protein
VLDFQCDEEIAELIQLMNRCGINTVMSCQDSNAQRGTVRRVWVDVPAEDLLPLLSMLDRADEVDELDSLSHRMAPEYSPGDPLEREAFDETAPGTTRPTSAGTTVNSCLPRSASGSRTPTSPKSWRGYDRPPGKSQASRRTASSRTPPPQQAP